MTLAQKLKEAREAKNLTQQMLSDTLGYSCGQFVSNWERGISLPPTGSLPTISKTYGVPVKELVDLWVAAQIEKYRSKLLRKVATL